MVFFQVLVLTRDEWLRGSHGLSARRARRTMSRGPKGLQLEVGARRALRLLVTLYYTYYIYENVLYSEMPFGNVSRRLCIWSETAKHCNWDIRASTGILLLLMEHYCFNQCSTDTTGILLLREGWTNKDEKYGFLPNQCSGGQQGQWKTIIIYGVLKQGKKWSKIEI